jgi:endo-1,4-beta-xylanase
VAAARQLALGTAVVARRLKEADYTSVLASEFSVVEPEFEMKFPALHPRPDSDKAPYDFAAADSIVSWAQDHGQDVRGHTLVWYSAVPTWLTQAGLAPEQIGRALQDHIRTVVGHFRANVRTWDVVNEAFNDDGSLRDSFWYNQPGIGFADRKTGYIEQSFRWARDAAPQGRLFYNDHGAETLNTKSDALYAMAADFVARKVPVDGIGFQVHVDQAFGASKTIASFKANLERFAQLGLSVQITELDVRLGSSDAAALQAQAEVYRKVAETCLAVRGCDLIQFWGFTDKYSSVASTFPGMGWALPWTDVYEKKPAYHAVLSALRHR